MAMSTWLRWSCRTTTSPASRRLRWSLQNSRSVQTLYIIPYTLLFQSRYVSSKFLSFFFQVLKLNNNNLTRIGACVVNLLRKSTSLTDLTLDDNPWSCNCFVWNAMKGLIDSNKMQSLLNASCLGSTKQQHEMTLFEEICPSRKYIADSLIAILDMFISC